MTPDQCFIISLALSAGVEHNVPELPGVIYQESRAGRFLVGDNGETFGIGHMRLSTALDTLKLHPKLWVGAYSDDKLIIRMLTDHKWTVGLVAKRINDVGLQAYNAGVEGAKKGRGKKYPKIVKEATKEALKQCKLGG